jgi:hypothetical protein
MIPQTDLSLRGDSIMRPFTKNSRRPQVEQLEDRCVPGSVLDLLGDPLLAPVGQSLVFLEATATAVAVATANPSPTSSPHETAAKVDAAFSPAGRGVRGIGGGSTIIDRARFATRPLVSPQDNTILAGPVAAGEQVPFKGSLEGVVTVTPLAPPFLSVLVNATGNATQLGEYTLAIPHIVDRANGTAIGTYQFTAANGDTLSADFTGQATPTPTPGVLSIVETATITGGTGQFAGATGGFTCQRLFNTNTGTTTGSFEGTISSPGAGKG